MTPRQFLIRLMKIKQEANPNLPYFTSEDEAELYKWTDEECAKVVNTLIPGFEYPSDVFTATCCPWCILAETSALDCPDCGYGERHGMCMSNDDGHNDFVNFVHSLNAGLGGVRLHQNRTFDKIKALIKEYNHDQIPSKTPSKVRDNKDRT